MPFLCSRLFWVSVMFWRLIPTSFMYVIELHSVWCFTHPVPNSRGRCCLSYACTSLLEQTLTATTVVRPRLDFTLLDSCCIIGLVCIRAKYQSDVNFVTSKFKVTIIHCIFVNILGGKQPSHISFYIYEPSDGFICARQSNDKNCHIFI